MSDVDLAAEVNRPYRPLRFIYLDEGNHVTVDSLAAAPDAFVVWTPGHHVTTAISADSLADLLRDCLDAGLRLNCSVMYEETSVTLQTLFMFPWNVVLCNYLSTAFDIVQQCTNDIQSLDIPHDSNFEGFPFRRLFESVATSPYIKSMHTYNYCNGTPRPSNAPYYAQIGMMNEAKRAADENDFVLKGGYRLRKRQTRNRKAHRKRTKRSKRTKHRTIRRRRFYKRSIYGQ